MTEQEQIQQWKEKAEKWDALEKEIATFYVDEEGNEIPYDEEGMGLIGIGEAAAMAFGFI